jgi:hypothetical protein
MKARIRAVLVPKPFSPVVPRSKYLWHLFRWNQLHKLDAFIQGGLWLSRLDQFNCAFEGSLPDVNLGLLDMLLTPDQAAYTKREYQLAKMRGYASCWHMSDHDPTEQIWQTKFGNRHKAIALKTTPSALQKQLSRLIDNTGPCHVGEVEYINHETDTVPEGNSIEVAFRVREQFSFQQEFRVYVHCYGTPAIRALVPEQSMWNTRLVRRVPARQSFSRKRELVGFVPPKASAAARKFNWKAIVLQVQTEQLIEEILIGCRVSDEEYASLMRLLDHSPLKGRVRREIRHPEQSKA